MSIVTIFNNKKQIINKTFIVHVRVFVFFFPVDGFQFIKGARNILFE